VINSELVFSIITWLIFAIVGTAYGAYWHGRNKEFKIWSQAEIDGHIKINSTEFLNDC